MGASSNLASATFSLVIDVPIYSSSQLLLAFGGLCICFACPLSCLPRTSMTRDQQCLSWISRRVRQSYMTQACCCRVQQPIRSCTRSARLVRTRADGAPGREYSSRSRYAVEPMDSRWRASIGPVLARRRAAAQGPAASQRPSNLLRPGASLQLDPCCTARSVGGS